MARIDSKSVEGLDGSGKSEVSRLIAERLGGVLLKIPPKEIVAAQNYIDDSNDEKLRLHYWKYSSIRGDKKAIGY